MVKELGVEQYVEFMGYRRDIPQLVALSDISVSASRREGLPVNLIEALAIGNPVIATNARGNSDVVEDGVNGYIIEQDNHQQMADKIYQVYSDKALYNKMSKASLQLSEKYSVENVNKSLAEIYKKYGVEFK